MQDTFVASSSVKLESKSSIFNKIKSIVHYSLKVFLNFLLTVLIIITSLFVISFADTKINEYSGRQVAPLIGAYVIVSPSMVPTIKVHDAILVARTNPKNLNVGDIITFKSTDSRYNGYTITHRINEINTTSDGKRIFITKGDNNVSTDSSPVLEENIYGKVILKFPKLGVVQQFVFTSVGFILVIFLPLILLVCYNLFKLYRLNKDKNKKVEIISAGDDIEII